MSPTACCRSRTCRAPRAAACAPMATRPSVRTVDVGRLAAAVADEVAAVRHRHHNTGVVAPAGCTRRSARRSPPHELRRGRSRARSRPRRRSGLHRRGGQGSRVRRRRGRQPAPDPRRRRPAAPACCTCDDPRRAGAALRHRRADCPRCSSGSRHLHGCVGTKPDVSSTRMRRPDRYRPVA